MRTLRGWEYCDGDDHWYKSPWVAGRTSGGSKWSLIGERGLVDDDFSSLRELQNWVKLAEAPTKKQ